MTTKPSISLCMIVCDEAECLPDFLAATHGLWDELCVVDAHSRDNTVKILADAGAQVVQQAWEDDFSRARNRSLEMATGEWVLYLDADELPDAQARASLRQIAGRADAGAALVHIENEFDHGWRTVAPLLRMFRRDPAVRFSHPIHEEVVEPVTALLIERGLELAHAEGIVAHSGYTPGRLAGRNKKAMSERILKGALARDPADLYNWFKLLESARFFGDEVLFCAEAPAATRALAAADEGRLASAHFGAELLVLLTVHQYPGRPALELAELMAWDGRLPANAAYNLRRGQVREELGDWAGATADFRACVDLYSQTHNLQLAGVRPLMGLARVAIARGELNQAVGYVELALGQAPRDPEAVLALVSLAQQLAGEAGCRRVVEAYRQDHGDCPELEQALLQLPEVLPPRRRPPPPAAGRPADAARPD